MAFSGFPLVSMEQQEMTGKSLIFVLDAQHPFISSLDSIGSIEENRFFDSLTYTYLPLLRACSNLESEGIAFKFAIVFSPVVCEMMINPYLQLRYVEHLDKSIAYGQNELIRCAHEPEQCALIETHIEFLTTTRLEYVDIYSHNILAKFDYFANHGFIEILATTATPAFLPMYVDIPESISAQIEIGLTSYRNYFTTFPDGFWLPAMGYTPGIEQHIKDYGFKYTLVDAHSMLFASPSSGIFTTSATSNGLSFLCRDKNACLEIIDSATGFYTHEGYLDTDRDIGFELDHTSLGSLFDSTLGRRTTGFRYWARQESQQPSKTLYNPNQAQALVHEQSTDFLKNRINTLNKAAEILEDIPVHSVCAFPIHMLGGSWFEGVNWFESVLRQAYSNESISLSLPKLVSPQSFISVQELLPIVKPLHSSWFNSGYSEEVLNSTNDWMYPYIRKALVRMVDLASRFPDDTGLKERSLNMAVREVLLAQSMDWFLSRNNIEDAENARQKFEEHINAFTVVFESLGSNFISTEWLTTTEKKHIIFSDINYRVFRQKQ